VIGRHLPQCLDILENLNFLNWKKTELKIFSKMELHIITATLFMMHAVTGFLGIGSGELRPSHVISAVTGFNASTRKSGLCNALNTDTFEE
jgi:hypothetical protein